MASNGGGNDTQQNCILEVCCPDDAEGQAKQVRALAKQLQHDVPSLTPELATEVARAQTTRYDFAPKGTLYYFKQAIARLAKGPAYTE